MDVYKLTNRIHQTRNGTTWGPNVHHKASGNGKSEQLCNNNWLHFYLDPYLAILLNPVHGHVKSPRLYKAKAEGKILLDGESKGGCTHLTTIEEIEPPRITLEQRRQFSALAALAVEDEPIWREWLQLVAQGEKPNPWGEFQVGRPKLPDHHLNAASLAMRRGVSRERYGLNSPRGRMHPKGAEPHQVQYAFAIWATDQITAQPKLLSLVRDFFKTT